MYKNPKKLKETESGPAKGKGASAMQPAASGVDASVGVKLMKGEAGDGTMVNEAEFLRRKAKDVPVDQVCTIWLFSWTSCADFVGDSALLS